MAPVRDTFTDIAAILIPWPDEHPDSDDFSHLNEQTEREQLAAIETMELAWEHDDQDPVLAAIHHARMKMLAAEQELRRLLAYARESTRPRPYTQADLAEAAGMSISGIRTAYDQDEIDYVNTSINTRAPRQPDR